MTEELGRIEKPLAADFKKGRKLYFIPLVYGAANSPKDYLAKLTKYWEQIEKHLEELEVKLGKVNEIFHELNSAAGEEGLKTIKELNIPGSKVIEQCLKKGAQLAVIEDNDLLTEFLDWSRCLLSGLQNRTVLTKVYDFYSEVDKKRNEFIAKKIDETLKANEIGILMMRENHQIKFPEDIELFYVAPPALDDLKRWIRDQK
jgi:hypothetical protein